MTSSGKKLLIGGGVVVALGAIAVLFVIPAETGWDPTGVGKATGLVEIADAGGEELERGMARMEQQEVLTLSDTALAPAEGITDVWEYQLAPFESVEFKYTIPEGAPITFTWEASGPLHYDLHAHPFEGGEEMTEGYGKGDAQVMHGRYTPAFTGIHGWYWQNRSMDTVSIRLDASGGMTTSTIFSGNGQSERPLAGAEAVPEGTVAGHEMRSSDTE
jgi:hypothetical protein